MDNEMTLTDAILLKYVDGHLCGEDVGHVEKLLFLDLQAQEKVALMRKSGAVLSELPIGENETGFAKDLQARLVHEAAVELPKAANDRLPQQLEVNSASVSDPKSFWNMGKIAAAMIVVAGTGFAGYQAGVGSLPAEEVQMANLPVWVARVVDYHTLYGRETVVGSRTSTAEMGALETKFGALLNAEIIIPDLSDAGLDFRRGQVLNFQGDEIIQLAYLPADIGKPVALCLRASSETDAEPNYSTIRGLEVARWRHNGIEYLMVGERSQSQTILSAELAMANI